MKAVITVGSLLLLAGCPGDDGRGDTAEHLKRALSEGSAATAADCAASLALVADTGRRRPDDLVGQAAAVLRAAGIHARLRSEAGSAHPDAACGEPLRRALGELAKRAHQRAQKVAPGAANDARTVAEILYRTYLDQFPGADDAIQMHFYHGELLWVGERWREAAEEYTTVAQAAPEGPLVREAAYAAMLARRNLVGPQSEGRADH